jgi:hypothetical protein
VAAEVQGDLVGLDQEIHGAHELAAVLATDPLRQTISIHKPALERGYHIFSGQPAPSRAEE